MKTKAINLLANIAYIGLKKRSWKYIFFVNVFTLIAQNLNPFTLDRKFENGKNQHWCTCFEKNVFQIHFIDIFAKNKTLCF